MTSTWKAAAGIILIFVFGCISGALSTSLFLHNEVLMLDRNPSEVADILESRFTRHLGLDQAQHAQIHDILMSYLQQRRALMARMQPELQENNRQMLAQIRSVLHPDQMAGFKDNLVQLRRRLAGAAFRPPEMGPSGTIGTTNAAPAQDGSTNAAPIQ
jgi:hypothetical protein